MFSFMRRHWVAYLVATIIALALGFGAAYFVRVKGSLPDEVRAERIAAEKKQAEAVDQIDEVSSGAEEDDDALDDSSVESGTVDTGSSDVDASSTGDTSSQTAEGEFQDVDTSENS